MSPRDDFEKRYFDQLDKRFDAIDDSIKANTEATEKGFKAVNGQINRLNKAVFPEVKETVQQLPSVWRDPQVLKIIGGLVTLATIAAVIVAALTGANLKGLF
jgi:hypothetical protein